ncbi:hypothetical protein [[Clostridium] innocuum]|nr:hypothetical protein [[Clostridium] innocuum]
MLLLQFEHDCVIKLGVIGIGSKWNNYGSLSTQGLLLYSFTKRCA